MPIKRFTKGPAETVAALNQIVELVNQLEKISGDEFINIGKSGGSTALRFNLNKLKERLGVFSGSGSGEIRRAKLTASAGATATITANLYNSAGVEQTTGDEAGVTVYCDIHGGTVLNAAIPRLATGEIIKVAKLPFLNGTILEQRWTCLTEFQASIDCDCAEL